MFPYIGGKKHHSKWIDPFAPTDAKTYVEVFGGAMWFYWMSNKLPVEKKETEIIFDDFLPWLGNFSNIKSSNFTETKDYDILKSVWQRPSKETLRAAIYETETQTKKNLVIIFLNTFLFLLLILTAFFRASLKMRLVLTFSLSAPLSWFIIAQGHSALHFGLNYVLWYLPLVPFCLIAIISKNNNKVAL